AGGSSLGTACRRWGNARLIRAVARGPVSVTEKIAARRVVRAGPHLLRQSSCADGHSRPVHGCHVLRDVLSATTVAGGGCPSAQAIKTEGHIGCRLASSRPSCQRGDDQYPGESPHLASLEMKLWSLETGCRILVYRESEKHTRPINQRHTSRMR